MEQPQSGRAKAGEVRALDELFKHAQAYNATDDYRALLDFVVRFPAYAPFNAMLAHAQKPGAVYVATAHEWVRSFGRIVKPGARPIVLLQRMGPVMFVFDVSDTEAGLNSRALPRGVKDPFGVRSGEVTREFPRTVLNAVRDGVRLTQIDAGSQLAGQIAPAAGDATLNFITRTQPTVETVPVPHRYDLLIDRNASRPTRYATLVHELAHLYCGHLGTPNPKWWPDRRNTSVEAGEFEAESVCFLVCRRRGIDTPSDEYLSGYLKEHKVVPSISLDRVLAAAGLIEQMALRRLPPRKVGSSQ